MSSEQLFDTWPDKYRQWFETPIGKLVQACEQRLIMELLQPQPGERFDPVAGDMRRLPFPAEMFDRSVSITALEFIEEAQGAVDELFRVTRRGGSIVVATLNSLSPWAERRSLC